jgi:valyl-tRNA synthetase
MPGSELIRDPDVLDTWFSSALWPFSTLGWPQKTTELEKFYPTDVLVTDRGIIFHWVARMVFSGLKFMGELPFKDVIIHGTVLDEQGRKMSKSLGNGVDPLVIIEEFGADVLRLMLISGNSIDGDTRFLREKLEPCRNFLNKLWNATRFVTMNLEGVKTTDLSEYIFVFEALPVEDRWILSRLENLSKEVAEKLEIHEMGHAAERIVNFIWDEFCDWYVEMVKPRLYAKGDDDETLNTRTDAQMTLCLVLGTAFKLLHPFTPFITDDLYRALLDASGVPTDEQEIMLAQWPTPTGSSHDPEAEKAIDRVKEAIRAIRAVRTEKQVPPSQKISVIILPSNEETSRLFRDTAAAVALLSGAKDLFIAEPNSPETPKNAVSTVIENATIYLPLDSLIDTEKERARLSKEKKKLEQEIALIDSKLSNQGFISKAPEKLIATEREKREKFVAMLAKIESEIGASPQTPPAF